MSLTVEDVAIDAIKPYDKNPRSISEAAIDKVAASIQAFGFQQPIVVDRRGVVIAGHTRLLAAKRLGLSTVPVVRADSLSDAQAKAYRVADNRTGEEAEWDWLLLHAELEALEEGFDVGFSDAEIKRISREMHKAKEPKNSAPRTAKALESVPRERYPIGSITLETYDPERPKARQHVANRIVQEQMNDANPRTLFVRNDDLELVDEIRRLWTRQCEARGMEPGPSALHD